MAKPYLEELTRKIKSLDLPHSKLVSLEFKHFFSGAALYANGNICASLSPTGFALKLPEETRGRLIEEGEGSEFRYFEKSPVKKEYVALSQFLVEDKKRLKSLLILSIRFVTDGQSAA